MKLITGSRQQVILSSVKLETSRIVSDIPIAYEAWGIEPSGRTPVILLIHALTGSSHACSTPEDSTAGWWEDFLTGPDAAVDLKSATIIAPNLPGSCYGSWVPDERDDQFLSIKDFAVILQSFLKELQITELHAVIGGSLGGMVALQICADRNLPISKAVILSCGARQSAWAKAWGHLGLTAIKNSVNDSVGLSLARQIAMLSYRTPPDFDSKDEENRTVQHYLYYQGTKFVNRFTRWSYELLVRAMDTHAVTKKIEGMDALIVGNKQDLLYPLHDQEAVCQLFDNPVYHIIDSDKGHDAFLTESEELNPVIRNFLGIRPATRLTLVG